jgi:hypothetical protein
LWLSTLAIHAYKAQLTAPASGGGDNNGEEAAAAEEDGKPIEELDVKMNPMADKVSRLQVQ